MDVFILLHVSGFLP